MSAADSPDLIKLTRHDWTGQPISAHIMGEVLKKLGDSVEYVQADYLAQFAGLETGDLHVAMEMWDTTGREAMDAAAGKVENFGPTGMKAKEEWWFPEHMKQKCPGLPNWEALKSEACAEAFSTAETAPKGRSLGGPVTPGGFDDERVEALGLPFEVIHAGTAAALFAGLAVAFIAIIADRLIACGCNAHEKAAGAVLSRPPAPQEGSRRKTSPRLGTVPCSPGIET